MADYLVPLLLLAVSCFALRKTDNLYACLLEGCADGLKLLMTLIPALVVLLTAVSMLRASGAMGILTELLAPIFSLLGIPKETALLVLIRPISGSAALAAGAELMAQYGADSRIGRTAAVMLGSTETTFYVLSLYCGTLGIRKTRYAVPAALIADLTGFVCASLSVRLFFPAN